MMLVVVIHLVVCNHAAYCHWLVSVDNIVDNGGYRN